MTDKLALAVEPIDIVEQLRDWGHPDWFYVTTDLLSDNQDVRLDAADEIERLRAALAPFAADKLPSSRRSEIAYNRDGLRCAMSPLQIAQTAAHQALTRPQGNTP